MLSTGSSSSADEDSSDLNSIVAEIVGIDSETDLALLKIARSELPR
jgi:S1-C subfamily serine protease